MISGLLQQDPTDMKRTVEWELQQPGTVFRTQE